MAQIRKFGNARVKDAEIEFLVYAAAGVENAPSMMLVLGAFKKAYGGLWVGGAITLDDNTLTFRANMLNRAIHKDLSEISIPLKDITSVNKRFGVLTGIIDIETDAGTLAVRLYGAKKFADKINAALP